MNELMERASKLWLTNPAEIMSTKRFHYIQRARQTFVFLALMDGFTIEKISEFTHWDKDKVNYYAGKSISDDVTFGKMQRKGLVKFTK